MVEEDGGDREQCGRITSRNGQKYHIMTASEWHKIENDGDPWQPTCWLRMAHNDDDDDNDKSFRNLTGPQYCLGQQHCSVRSCLHAHAQLFIIYVLVCVRIFLSGLHLKIRLRSKCICCFSLYSWQLQYVCARLKGHIIHLKFDVVACSPYACEYDLKEC